MEFQIVGSMLKNYKCLMQISGNLNSVALISISLDDFEMVSDTTNYQVWGYSIVNYHLFI